MPLNAKQERFVREYLISLNATQAAVKAGYSVATAKSQGSRLLTHADVKAALATGGQAIAEKQGLNAERVLGAIDALAHSDLLSWFNDDGTLKHPQDMTPEARACIAAIEFEELWEGDKANGKDGESKGRFVVGRIVKIKLWDKPKALEMQGRHLKLFTDKLEVKGTLTLEQLIDEAAARGKGELT